MCLWSRCATGPFLAARSIKGRYGTYFAAYDDELRNRLLREQAITDSMEPALAKKEFEVYSAAQVQDQGPQAFWGRGPCPVEASCVGLSVSRRVYSAVRAKRLYHKAGPVCVGTGCIRPQGVGQQGISSHPVSVNVSRADIYHKDLADSCWGIVRRYRLQPSRLHLEITESA